MEQNSGQVTPWFSLGDSGAAYSRSTEPSGPTCEDNSVSIHDSSREPATAKIRRLEPRGPARMSGSGSSSAAISRAETAHVASAPKQTILLVDDDEELGQGLEVHLLRDGYKVIRATRGQAGLDLAREHRPDLILLDVNMPGTSGLDVCRELRKQGMTTPIIMLTARSEEIDKVLGLELGADDYVTKPFGVRELVARIRARLRREPASAPERETSYRFEDIEIDFDKCRVTRAGAAVELTPKEFDILRLLVRNRGQIVSRDQLLSEVWGYQVLPNTRTVDNHILKLRQKLEPQPGSPKYILSVYGEGYKFVG